MSLTRRRALLLAGMSFQGAVVAGCLDGGSGGLGAGDGNDGNDEGTDGDDGRDTGDSPAGTDDGTDTDGENDTADQTGDEGDLPDGVARVDELPHPIDEPACLDGESEPLYLCAGMAAEPSLSFETVETTAPVLVDEGLSLDEPGVGSQFYATLLTDEADLDRVDDAGDPADPLEGIDFGTEVVLIVQTGWGSGSVTPRLKRIEETDRGVRAHGCYLRPCGGTGDVTLRTAVVRFDRPNALETAIVSLTVRADSRA